MIRLDQLEWVIAPYSRRSLVDSLYDAFEPALLGAGIDTPLRQAAFIAQTAHETMRYVYMEELADGSAYEGRADLGNTEEGDGPRFRGRGLLMLTGRANYAAYSERAYGDDRLLDYPELLEEADDAIGSACWFWVEKGLNRWADAADLVNLTRRINGGLNGWDDRLALYKRAVDAFGL